MKLLNLDEIVAPRREVVINGKTYALAERTLEHMIKSIQLAEETRKTSDAVQHLTNMREAVRNILVDCPEEVINSLNWRKLNALLEFANASDEEIAEGSVANEEGAAQGNAAKS